MRRIREIIADIRNRYPDDDFFSNFEKSCRTSLEKRKHYRAYNNALIVLDDQSWQILKKKAVDHYFDHREGQKKQGFFNQLNEAFAYRYLVDKGFENVRCVKEKKKSPDIEFTIQNTQGYCEVKTLGISDDEIVRRSMQGAYDGSVYVRLSNGFLKKFRDAVKEAEKQIHAFGTSGLIYIVIHFDDIALDHYEDYRKQLIAFSKDQGFQNLLIKIGLLGNRRICIASGCPG